MTHPFVDDYFRKQDQTTWLKFVMFQENQYLSKAELSEKTKIKFDTVRKYLDRLTEQQQILEVTQGVEENSIKKYMLTTIAREDFGKQVARIEQEAYHRENTQKEEESASELIQKFNTFIDKHHYAQLVENIRKGLTFLEIDFKSLAEFDPKLADLLLDEPEKIIQCVEQACLQFDTVDKLEHIDIHVSNIPQTQGTNIAHIRRKMVDKLVLIRGRIVNKTFPYARVTNVKFECPSCGNSSTLKQEDLYFSELKKCSCGRKGKFKIVETHTIDEQRLVAEELPENMIVSSQLANINVELQHHLTDGKKTDKYIPGSRVQIVGVLHAVPKKQNMRNTTQLDYILRAKHVKVLDDNTPEDIKFTKEDLDLIHELSKKENPIKELMSSAFPDVYGSDTTKQMLILQQFSGWHLQNDDGTHRYDMHILLVGDPGTAKTKLARSIQHIAPNARLASGTGITGVGLTGTVRKDDFTQNWFVQAGLLPLCHEGTAVIDELEKGSEEDIDRMHEAMENQEIHIDKSHVHAKLLSQCKILATCNPLHSRFEPNGKNIIDQVPLKPTILDRFDYIIVSRDIVDKKKDQHVARTIVEQGIRKQKVKYSSEFITKYLLYAKKFNPVTSKEINDAAVAFYTELRQSSVYTAYEGKKPTPRALWSIIRLSTAIARAKLKNNVNKQDLMQAIELHGLIGEQSGLGPAPTSEVVNN